MPEKGLTSLNQHLDLAWLREAYRRTRKDGAVGVDGQTAADYERDLEGSLRSLLERAKSGTYRAPPVRRVHIPKGTGGDTRPIGIPTLEDKVLQRAIVMLLEPIYEEDFYAGIGDESGDDESGQQRIGGHNTGFTDFLGGRLSAASGRGQQEPPSDPRTTRPLAADRFGRAHAAPSTPLREGRC
jgi:hypothetical protein